MSACLYDWAAEDDSIKLNWAEENFILFLFFFYI